MRTVYKLIDVVELRAYKVARVIRVRRADLEEFLEAHTIEPGSLSNLYPPPSANGEDEDGPIALIDQSTGLSQPLGSLRGR